MVCQTITLSNKYSFKSAHALFFVLVRGIISSGSWFRLRPEGGLSGLEIPNSAKVRVGGLPTSFLGVVVAALQTARRYDVRRDCRALVLKRLGAQVGLAVCW